MTYFQGFLIPVKIAEKQAYIDMAAQAAPWFAEYGATRTVECWGDDVTAGKRTDMKRAVQAEPDENVVFSWMTWPDKATCDAAAEKMQSDERMKPSPTMPFDGQRMIYAGFEIAHERGSERTIGYVDGIVAAVPDERRAAFVDFAAATTGFFHENGATRTIDGWGADVPDGKVTDFKRAVQAEAGETVVFGWVEWPDKATRDVAMTKMMTDQTMAETAPPWNGPTAIFGGFAPVLDTLKA